MPKISTGVILKSKSGRELSPVPKIDCTTDRKITNSLKRMFNWMKDEAIKECNDFVKPIVSRMNPDKMSNADVSFLNDILFCDKIA